MRFKSSRQTGFSLIELMVGMTVGLIMLAAVVALTTSILRTNAETITVAKLTQEGRAIGDLVSRELKRARYAGNYLQFVGAAGAVPNQFNRLEILDGSGAVVSSGNCIRFAYDSDDDGAIAASPTFPQEVKVISLRNSAVFFGQYTSYAAATCTADALRISSPDVQITNLNFSRITTGATPSPNRIDVGFQLQLTGNAAVKRRFDQAIQVRNPFL